MRPPSCAPFSYKQAYQHYIFRMHIIDNFTRSNFISALGTHWRCVTDQVMGGISEAKIKQTRIDNRPALRLYGDVRLENNGGFVQASLDLSKDDTALNASAFNGVRLTVLGNSESYGVHLRTNDTRRPWQSYRSIFTTATKWTVIYLPFNNFVSHRLETPFDTSGLRRIGLAAIGREFRAALAVSDIRFYC